MQKAVAKPPLLKVAGAGQRKAPIVKNRVKFSNSKDVPAGRESSSVPRQRSHGGNRDLGVRTSSASGAQ